MEFHQRSHQGQSDPHAPLGAIQGPVRLHENLCFERLARFYAARQSEFLHRYIVPALDPKGHHVDAHTQRLCRACRRHRIANIFVPIGEHDQSLLPRFWKSRRAQANRSGQIRPLRPNHCRHLVELHDLVGRRFKTRIGPKY